MSIDLTIPGDPDAITALGDWMDDLKKAAEDTPLDLLTIAMKSQGNWRGAAADAFRKTARKIEKAAHPLASYYDGVGAVFRAYANRLSRGRDEFDYLLFIASAAGLEVTGEIVMPPTTSLQYCPGPGSPQADLDAYEEHLEQVDVYNDISEKVGTWWGELEKWIAEHMAPLARRVGDFDKLPSVLDALKRGNEEVVKIALEHQNQRMRRDISTYLAQGNKMQADADAIRKALRSGNPAVKAAADAANPRALREGLDDLNDSIRDLDKLSNGISKLAGAADILSLGIDIANGESPSGASLEYLAGGGASFLAGQALAGTTVPPYGAALIIGGSSVAVGSGARWLYESWVGIDVRESIDNYFTGPLLLAPPRRGR